MISQVAPGVRWESVQPVGPSPAILHLTTLRQLTVRCFPRATQPLRSTPARPPLCPAETPPSACRPSPAPPQQKWLDYSIALKLLPEADAMFGWVLEMWG